MAGTDLQRGRLKPLLSEYIPFDNNALYAVYLPHRYVPAKLHAFIDFLLERFGPEPYWDRPGRSSIESKN